MIIIAAIAYTFWAVLGFIFWLPLLFRVVAGFCGTLIYNMLANNPEKIQNSKISLDLAISFYIKGFQTIHSTLYEKINASGHKSKNEFRILFFLGQLLWALIFWGLIILPFTKDKISAYFKTFNYSARKYIEEADKYLSIHDTTTAIRMISGAINKDKFNAEFYYKRGMIYYNTSSFKNAVEDLESAINLDSLQFGNKAEIIWKIGAVYSNHLKNYQKAIPYLTSTIKYSPKFAEAYLLRGVCYYISGEKVSALNDYNSAIMLDPNNAIVYSNKGLLLIETGQKAEACLLFDQAIKKGFEKAIKYQEKYCK